jgi:CheY-like chemotaxis protein
MLNQQLSHLRSHPLVLIVDGHDDTREMYALSLTAVGFETVEVVDSGDAYEHVGQSRPDLIVTEIILQHYDGWTLLRRVKADPETCDIPVIILTTLESSSLHNRAEHEGCSAVIVKPCTPDQLAAALWLVLERSNRQTT